MLHFSSQKHTVHVVRMTLWVFFSWFFFSCPFFDCLFYLFSSVKYIEFVLCWLLYLFFLNKFQANFKWTLIMCQNLQDKWRWFLSIQYIKIRKSFMPCDVCACVRAYLYVFVLESTPRLIRIIKFLQQLDLNEQYYYNLMRYWKWIISSSVHMLENFSIGHLE